MKLEFSEAAVEDLIRLRKFIAEHNPESAQRVSRQLISAIQRLLKTPQIGWVIPALPGEIREFVFGRYVVRYEVVSPSEQSKEATLYILKIWHGKEDR